MRMKLRYAAWCAAWMVTFGITACGNDQASDDDGGGNANQDGSGGREPGSGGGPGQGEAGGPNQPDPTDPNAGLPSAFAVAPACVSLLAPICQLTYDDDDKVTAYCSDKILSGTLSEDEDGNKSITTLNSDTISCTVDAGYRGLKCTPEGEAVKSCSIKLEDDFIPGLECAQLPEALENLTLTPSSGGNALELGTCVLSQNGCNFQANCGDAGTLVGTVTNAGLNFLRTLKALADSGQDVEPAFAADDNVEHACSITLADSVTGKCEAGGRAGGRGGNPPAVPHTSVYDITGGVKGPTGVCDPLAPLPEGETTLASGSLNEYMFVLDSCDLNKPYIGEPVCLYRQNNCAWQVQCGADLLFGGKLEPGKSKAQFKLPTGTNCEGGFENGKFTGSCIVPQPGAEACWLGEKTAEPGEPGRCDVLYDGEFAYTPGDIIPDDFEGPDKTPGLGDLTYSSHGCGNASVQCRLGVQHGCNYMSVCKMGNRWATIVIAGQVEGDTMTFNGAGDYSRCEVKKVSEAEEGQRATYRNTLGNEIEAQTVRVKGEWYGNCENPTTGGTCTNGVMGSGGDSYEILGLRVFFQGQACGLQHFTPELTTPACTAEQLAGTADGRVNLP